MSSLKLRDNQREAVAKAIAFFQSPHRPALIVLPTAWGKSVLAAFVARAVAGRLLVVQPSKELLAQNKAKFEALTGEEAGVYSASAGRKDISRITFATIGSIVSLGKEFREMGFNKMLVDEAHLYPRSSESMIGRFLHDSGISHVLGITATPLKLETEGQFGPTSVSKLVMLTSKSKEGQFYEEILHVSQVQEMIAKGYWSPLRYEQEEFDTRNLTFNGTGAEYTEESQLLACEANNVFDKVRRALREHSECKHILVFMPSVETAVALASEYEDGVAVYGDMPKEERSRAIDKFRAGKKRIVFNVRVLSTGFDYTGIDCIILAKPTASFALYYQIVGRATRIDPHKRDALIIDLVGSVSRFGKVEDITIEQGASGMWRIFGTGGMLLTGIPIPEIGNYWRRDVASLEGAPLIATMPFGKYRGRPIRSIPLQYRRWLLKNVNWQGKEALRNALLAG